MDTTRRRPSPAGGSPGRVFGGHGPVCRGRDGLWLRDGQRSAATLRRHQAYAGRPSATSPRPRNDSSGRSISVLTTKAIDAAAKTMRNPWIPPGPVGPRRVRPRAAQVDDRQRGGGVEDEGGKDGVGVELLVGPAEGEHDRPQPLRDQAGPRRPVARVHAREGGKEHPVLGHGLVDARAGQDGGGEAAEDGDDHRRRDQPATDRRRRARSPPPRRCAGWPRWPPWTGRGSTRRWSARRGRSPRSCPR